MATCQYNLDNFPGFLMAKRCYNNGYTEIGYLPLPRPSTAEYDQMSPFARWLVDAIDSRGASVNRVAEKVGIDPSQLHKIIKSYLPRYAAYQRPGIEYTMAIGELLGDLPGALEAAGYPAIDRVVRVEDKITLADSVLGGRNSEEDNSPTRAESRPLATWLRTQRQLNGLSQVSLAERAGIDQGMVSKIENGRTDATRNMIERLAQALVPADLPSDEAEAAYDRLLRAGLRAAFLPDEPELFEESREIAARVNMMPEEDQRLFLELARAKTQDREEGRRSRHEPIGPDYNTDEDAVE